MFEQGFGDDLLSVCLEKVTKLLSDDMYFARRQGACLATVLYRKWTRPQVSQPNPRQAYVAVLQPWPVAPVRAACAAAALLLLLLQIRIMAAIKLTAKWSGVWQSKSGLLFCRVSLMI